MRLLPRISQLGRRGNIAVMTALLGVPLAGFVGLATDGARAWVLQSRLYTAVDAAALAMARNVGVPAATRDAEAAGMFWTNFGVPPVEGQPVGAAIGGTRRGFMGSAAVFDPPEQLDSGTVRVSATAAIPAYFTRLLGFEELRTRALAEARRADLGLELALVLDVTGSMDAACTPGNRGAAQCGFTPVPRVPGAEVAARDSNMDRLRLAAADLVHVLYGNRETVPNLWVSVVPYTTTINIGPQRRNWLTADAQANLDANFSPTQWRGCVEARVGYAGAPADGDRRDYTPAEHPFRPFYYRSTLGQYTLNGNPVPGDNDWARLLWNASTVGQNAITEDFMLWRGNLQVGPNVGCPMVPILPLTAQKTTVLNTIEALRPTFRGGTMGNLGLQGGWFTLSPRWQAAWNLGPTPPGQATPLPLAYNARFMRKVMVMMTDGNNTWFDSPTGFPGACGQARNTGSAPTGAPAPAAPGPPQQLQPLACPPANEHGNVVAAPGAPPRATQGDYTGYGRPSDGRATPAQVDARMATMCEEIKATGIVIYTVVVNTGGTVNEATRNLYRACATVPANYFEVSQPNQLRAAFTQIGQQLANLRVTR